MKKTISLFISILLLNLIVKSQTTKSIEDYLQTRNEAYITIKFNDLKDIENLNKIVSVDRHSLNKKSNEINAYVNTNQYKELLNSNFELSVNTPPSLVKTVEMCSDNSAVINWNCYPTYEQYLYLMNKFVSDYPQICSLHEIGQSVDGRKVLAIKISDNVNVEEEEPAFLYSATMHGDETVGYVLMLRLIDYLLSNYANIDRIQELIDTKEIWINPLANPDGTYASGDLNVNGAIRYNSNSFDLNRNFPDPQYGEYPGGTRQVETQDMMDFMQANNFVLSANFHGGAVVVNYPWDTWIDRHADDLWYQNISHQYADIVHDNSSGYMLDFTNGITNGYDWYSTHGNRQDYVNYFLHSRETTIELSKEKMPSASELNNFWNYNYNSLLTYIEALNTGVYGKVTDIDGNPIHAQAFIETDISNSDVFSEQDNGMYFRLLNSGIYNFTYKASGYKDKVVSNVSVTENAQTELNVQLEKSDDSVNINSILEKDYKLISYINPFRKEINLKLEFVKETEMQVSIYNISGKLIIETTSKIYDAGVNIFKLETQFLENGYYICVLKSPNMKFDLKLVKI